MNYYKRYLTEDQLRLFCELQKNFGWFDSLKELANKANKRIDPKYKTDKEILEERRQNRLSLDRQKQRELEEKISSISRQHKIALEIEKESEKYYPTWGDGDEYPVFYVSRTPSMYLKVGDICLGEISYCWNGQYWAETGLHKYPRRVNNLKLALLNKLKTYKKEYQKIDYLDSEQIDEVIIYLEHLIQIISRSSL